MATVERRPDAERPSAAVDELTAAELAALRLSAQVMAHKADLANRHAVRLFFESLEGAVLAELAGRSQAPTAPDVPAAQAAPAVLFSTALGDGDSRLIAEYLELLANNGRLPAAVRLFCRQLGGSMARHGGDA